MVILFNNIHDEISSGEHKIRQSLFLWHRFGTKYAILLISERRKGIPENFGNAYKY
jgi:hypothetical protein